MSNLVRFVKGAANHFLKFSSSIREVIKLKHIPVITKIATAAMKDSWENTQDITPGDFSNKLTFSSLDEVAKKENLSKEEIQTAWHGSKWEEWEDQIENGIEARYPGLYVANVSKAFDYAFHCHRTYTPIAMEIAFSARHLRKDDIYDTFYIPHDSFKHILCVVPGNEKFRDRNHNCLVKRSFSASTAAFKALKKFYADLKKE